MCHVGRCEVIGVHLVFQLGNRRIDEEGRVGAAGAAPDDVGWSILVERCGFGDDAHRLGGGGEVAAYVVESLGLGSRCSFLDFECWFEMAWVRVRLARTEMYKMASWSFATSLATMVTFAPFSASWRATLRPMPFEPPVMRTVCAELLACNR